MPSKRLACCLFLTLAASACVDPDALDEGGLGTDEFAISNAPSTNVNRESIQLEFKYGAAEWGPCTGLALSRHWVITAAHCVERFPTGGWVVGSLKLRATSSSDGTSDQIYGPAGGGYGRAQYFRHPAWNGSGADKADDLALIRLDSNGIVDPTYNYRGAIYWDDREPWDVGSTEWRNFFVAGYGYGTPTGNTSRCDAGRLYTKRLGMFDLDPSIGYYSGAYVAKARTSYGSDICEGDSGAPWLLLRGGRYMTFALHSGDYPTAENGGYEFGTLVRPKMGWIESTTIGQFLPLVCSNTRVGGYLYRSCGE